MTIDITADNRVTEAMPSLLHTLAEQLRSAGLAGVKEATLTVPGQKDAGITLAISIGGLVLSLISTLISVLTFFKQQHPSLIITAKYGDDSVEIRDFSSRELSGIAFRIHEQGPEQVTIQIAQLSHTDEY